MGSAVATDDLIISNMRLASAIARRFRGRGVPWEDLVGEANLALVEAAREWPASKAKRDGRRFGTFAAFHIEDALRAAVANARIVRVPEKMQRKMRLAVHTAGRLAQAADRAVTDQEVAAELGWPVERVRKLRMLAATAEALSLDDKLPEDDKEQDTYADFLADPNVDIENEVIDRLQAEADRAWLIEAIDSLPPVMRFAVSLRCGIPVPHTANLQVEDVLRVAIHLSSYTDSGIRKLRKERGLDGGAMGTSDGRNAGSFGHAPCPPDSEGRRHRTEDIWRRYSSGEWTPPALAMLNE